MLSGVALQVPKARKWAIWAWTGDFDRAEKLDFSITDIYADQPQRDTI